MSFVKPLVSATVKTEVAAEYQDFWDSLVLLLPLIDGSGNPVSIVGPAVVLDGAAWATRNGLLGVDVGVLGKITSASSILGVLSSYSIIVVFSSVEGSVADERGSLYVEVDVDFNRQLDLEFLASAAGNPSKILLDNYNYQDDSNKAIAAQALNITVDGKPDSLAHCAIAVHGAYVSMGIAFDGVYTAGTPVITGTPPAPATMIEHGVGSDNYAGPPAHVSFLAILNRAVSGGEAELLSTDPFGLIRIAEVVSDSGTGRGIPTRLLRSRSNPK